MKKINELISGHQQFYQKYFGEKNNLFDALVKLGQQPNTLIISCCDSRVDPSIILGCEPGDLFVIRNVANLVPPFENDSHYHGTSAAIEFAVCNLGIKDIIVLGHSYCGGIRALMENESFTTHKGFIAKWMELAKDARAQTLANHIHLSLDEKSDVCGQYALIHSLNNLMTFPWIKEKVLAKTLTLHGWYFDLSTGMIKAFNPKNKEFELLS